MTNRSLHDELIWVYFECSPPRGLEVHLLPYNGSNTIVLPISNIPILTEEEEPWDGEEQITRVELHTSVYYTDLGPFRMAYYAPFNKLLALDQRR